MLTTLNSIYPKENTIKKSIYILLILICIYMMFPSHLDKLKVVLIIFLMLFSMIQIILNNRIYRPNHLLYSLLFAKISVLSLAYGYNNGFSIDKSLIQIYLLTPIVVYFLSTIVKNEDDFFIFFTGLRYIFTGIVIYDLIYILGTLNIIPQFLTWETEFVILSDGFLSSRLENMNSLMFLYPMELVYLFLFKGPKKLAKFNIFFGSIVILLSGRRSLQIIAILALLIIGIIYILSLKVKLRKFVNNIFRFIALVIIIIIIGKILSNLLRIDNIFSSFISTIMDAFNSQTTSYNIRSIQTNILITEWMGKPILGHGLSGYVPYYIRSTVTKWSYEHFYVAFLFQTGLLGIFSYGTYLVIILKNIINNFVQSNELNYVYFSILFGFMFYLLASATNPMLTSMWPWIIIMISSNKYLTERRID